MTTETTSATVTENGPANGARHKGGCSVPVPDGADRCPGCGVLQPGNLNAAKNPDLARFRRGEVPSNLRLSSEELLNGIVSDLGGVEGLSTIELELIRTMADLRAARLLLMVTVDRIGITTKVGRGAYDQLLATADRIHRLAATLGLKRRTRRVTPATMSDRLSDLPDIQHTGDHA